MYAAGDLLLMPSRVEPCGLNQLYAMKYGTIPVVRGIGGLRDTVVDVSDKDGYGFVFPDPEAEQASACIIRAVNTISEKKKFDQIRKFIMQLDYSWENSAKKYVKLYHRLVESYDA